MSSIDRIKRAAEKRKRRALRENPSNYARENYAARKRRLRITLEGARRTLRQLLGMDHTEDEFCVQEQKRMVLELEEWFAEEEDVAAGRYQRDPVDPCQGAA